MAARAEVRRLLKDELPTATAEELKARHGVAMRGLADEALEALLEHTDIPVSRRQVAQLRERVHGDVVDFVKDGLPAPIGVNLIMPAGRRAWEIEIEVDALRWWDSSRDLKTPEECMAYDEGRCKSTPYPIPSLTEGLIQAAMRLCEQDVKEIIRQCGAILPECDDVEEFWLACSDELVTDKLKALLEDKVARLVTRHPGFTYEEAMANWHADSFDGLKVSDQIEAIRERDEVAYKMVRPLAGRVAYEAWLRMEYGIRDVLEANAKAAVASSTAEGTGLPPP